ncbi:ankyrin repeat domain-containing protein [Azospirillum sp. SYSU D00513]|uniref:ankyrin repeat domain-containing protein n=1 Tax=Azospirillum sp. SYSU D00513 TaxID=2812561 RepID=UPI001FFEBB7E|nr:ankyrin repeat domain-containing protein [Azospirillum sp. SYSU D00513]
MDRNAPKPASSTPRTPTASLRPDQREVYDGLLLALLARKRLLVLVGDAGTGRAGVFGHLLEHVASDGALVLPVAARTGAQVEELIAEAGDGVLPSEEERDFETLIGELEERLDLAGYGLLAVEQAQLLAVATLSDLVDLSQSETPAGRSLQVLLCGTPELERMLAAPELAPAVRESGVIYRLAPGATPSVSPAIGLSANPVLSAKDTPTVVRPMNRGPAREHDRNEAGPPDFDRAEPGRRDPHRLEPVRQRGEPIPEPGEPEMPRFQQEFRRPANDGVPPGAMAGAAAGADPDFARIDAGWPPPDNSGWAAPPPRRRLSPALLAGVALTTLVLAGTGVALTMPDSPLVERPAAALRDGWNGVRAFADQNIGNPFATPEANPSANAGAANGRVPGFDPLRSPVAVLPNRPGGTGLPGEASNGTGMNAAGTNGSAPNGYTPPRAEPPATVAALPPPPPATQPDRGAAGGLAGSTAGGMAGSGNGAEGPAELDTNSPETSTAVLPPLEDPPNAGGLPPAEPQGSGDAGDPAEAERVRALVEEARRQIAAKHLTTPAGDNAYETVRRLRALSPNAPEIQELLASMESTYRRWASFAEQRGDFGNARHFYERALIVAPSKDELRERIETSDKREAEAQSGTSVKPGLESREAAIALLRQPAALRDLLNGSNANPNARVGDGKSLLMLASEQGMTEAVRTLLQKRARTDLRTGDGATAVMYAAWGGHEDVVRALADAGADLDATNADGKTALMAAAARGHAGVVKALLDRGVTVDRATGHGWTSLMYAANNGHERIVRMLVERGANPYRMDNDGNSALTLGALQGHVQVVEVLKPR